MRLSELRNTRLFLEDILVQCEFITESLKGHTEETLHAEPYLYDALLRRLTILGEAAKHVPIEVREAIPEVPWRQITGMRDYLVHVYFGLTASVIWDTLVRDIPQIVDPIRSYLRTVLDPNPPESQETTEP